ncbi:MAG: DUF1269 domain-containing protein [Candidatus Manganitrophus sp.]|nr:DUF1269 domain-containing protein [Candidatus Manganitrophus sp.]WDT70405.1 MAG: DUF1269 domain-containing protein [Candidatus Manganitrophus sp.]WDT82365.1 MAG: DUF1269 domain-containing protein [Candidatus Manganitrophus sp.]
MKQTRTEGETIMSKFILVVFPNEEKAYEGTRALHQLHNEGSISLYGTTVIKREEDGSLSVKQREDQGPVGMGVGALTGGLIGLLGGPVGGAIGFGAGTLLGSLQDLYDLGVDADFINEVSQKFAPGKTALVAEVSEDWVTPLDTRMEAIGGGTVVREWRDDFIHERTQRRIDALKAELARRKEEHAKTKADMQAKASKRVDEVREKLKKDAEKARTRLEQYKKEGDAKIAKLQEQASKTNADAKAKIDKRIAEMRANHEKRTGKLKQSLDQTQEAVKAA